MDRQERIPALEGLRAYLAWWVVAFHLMLNLWLDSPALPLPLALLSQGGHAVTIFIVISGFVIFRLLDRQQETYRRYILRRFLRLFPVFAVGALVSGAFFFVLCGADLDGLAIAPLGTLERHLAPARVVLDNVGVHLLLNATMLQGVPPESLVPAAGFGFNPAAWSVSLEWQFYLVAPALIFAWRRPRIGVCLLIAVAAAAYGLSETVGPHRYPSFLPRSLPWFILGMISWLIYRNGVSRRTIRALCAGAVLLWALATARALGALPGGPQIGAENTAIPAAIWISFLALLLGRDGRSGPAFRLLFENPAILALGRCSYSTYLLHRVILWLVLIGAAEALGGADPVVLLLICVGLALPLIAAVSQLSYRYVEAPPIAWAKRLGASQRPARTAAAEPA